MAPARGEPFRPRVSALREAPAPGWMLTLLFHCIMMKRNAGTRRMP